MRQDLIEKYFTTVKTAADLQKMGVVPKSFKDTLRLLAVERLERLAADARKQLRPDIVGEWVPLYEPRDVNVTELTDGALIQKHAEAGMRAEGTGSIGITSYRGLKGRVLGPVENVAPYGPCVPVEFESPVNGGTDLAGRAKMGHGVAVPVPALKLISETPIKIGEQYQPREDVEISEESGHIVRFSQPVEFNAKGNDMYATDKKVRLPAGTTAYLVKRDGGRITFKFEKPVAEGVDQKLYAFNENGLADKVEVSTLGQYAPVEPGDFVRKEVLRNFLPRTVLQEKRVRRILLSPVLQGIDTIFHGPPGSGKTSAAMDLVWLAEQQGIIFKVQYKNGDACNAQCHPFSLLGEKYGFGAFAKEVIPCPDCQSQFSPDFLKTGIYFPPKPEDLHVMTCAFQTGFGMERAGGGSSTLNPRDMLGYKLPKFGGDETNQALLAVVMALLNKNEVDDEVRKSYAKAFDAMQTKGGTENDFDPRGLRHGKLGRTNNGILLLDEFHRLLETTVESMLQASEENTIQPDQLRHLFPSNQLILGTANDVSNIPSAINDRFALIYVPHSETPEDAFEVQRRAVHKLYGPMDGFLVSDVHSKQPIRFDSFAVPVNLDHAIASFYMKLDKEKLAEQEASGGILTSGRSRKDAFGNARASLFLDKTLDVTAKTPNIVDQQYVEMGIKEALRTRIQGDGDRQAKQQKRANVYEWVEQTFPGVVAEESKVWACNVKKAIGRQKTGLFVLAKAKGRVAPDLGENFKRELEFYCDPQDGPDNALTTYRAMRKAYSDTAKKDDGKAKLEYPFMDLLFSHREYGQPHIAKLDDAAVKELVPYLASIVAKTECPK